MRLCSRKLFLMGQKILYSGKSVCIRANWLYLGKIGFTRASKSGFRWEKVLVFGQSGFYREKCLYFCKVVVFGQEWLYSGNVVAFGQKWL